MKRLLKHKLLTLVILVLVLFGLGSIAGSQHALADTTPPYCGQNDQGVHTAINFGCDHSVANPILDMLFAFIRFLSAGVGILVIASIVVGGIQFAASRSDPQASANAINRIRTSLIALVIYIFAYAILNFIIPGGFFT